MAFDKAIKSGKEHRKPYTGSKAIDGTCRNHGGCEWCAENRKHKFRDKQEDEIKEWQHCEDLCVHAPPSKKWPCIDCDMRYHDRAEPPKEEEHER